MLTLASSHSSTTFSVNSSPQGHNFINSSLRFNFRTLPSPLAHMFPASRLGQMGRRQRRGLRGLVQAYPAGPDWQMRKCKGGEEPGPPEVPVSPCRSAGSLPLAGRQLGGEKAGSGEQGGGWRDWKGGLKGGRQAVRGG